jgi:hypothetical protein
MKEKHKIYIIVCITIVLTVIVTVLALAYSGAAMQNAGTLTTSSDLQTYTASGFSFKYSATDFYVSNDTADGWILVMPIALKNNPNGNVEGIVISPRQNNPSETALDWLKDPNAGGYDISQGYNTVPVAGQTAISVENGDWVVVNTPDNSQRLSIAILPSSATSTSLSALTTLQYEMALVLNSLSFGK